MTYLAQALEPQAFAALVPQLGFGGLVLWLVIKRLDKIEIAVIGLTRAIWVAIERDPSTAPPFVAEARKTLEELNRK